MPKAPSFERFYPDDAHLAKRAKFFFENAGSSYSPKTETKHQGQMRGAMMLAEAEDKAEKRGWKYVWEDDPEGWDSLGDIDPEEVNEMLWARLEDHQGKVLASLGSIAFGHESGQANRRYGEVIEAELALEALLNTGWNWTPPKGFK